MASAWVALPATASAQTCARASPVRLGRGGTTAPAGPATQARRVARARWRARPVLRALSSRTRSASVPLARAIPSPVLARASRARPPRWRRRTRRAAYPAPRRSPARAAFVCPSARGATRASGATPMDATCAPRARGAPGAQTQRAPPARRAASPMMRPRSARPARPATTPVASPAKAGVLRASLPRRLRLMCCPAHAPGSARSRCCRPRSGQRSVEWSSSSPPPRTAAPAPTSQWRLPIRAPRSRCRPARCSSSGTRLRRRCRSVRPLCASPSARSCAAPACRRRFRTVRARAGSRVCMQLTHRTSQLCPKRCPRRRSFAGCSSWPTRIAAECTWTEFPRPGEDWSWRSAWASTSALSCGACGSARGPCRPWGPATR